MASSSRVLRGEAIGIAYYLPKWFRYALQEWIHSRMQELEAPGTAPAAPMRWLLGEG